MVFKLKQMLQYFTKFGELALDLLAKTENRLNQP